MPTLIPMQQSMGERRYQECQYPVGQEFRTRDSRPSFCVSTANASGLVVCFIKSQRTARNDQGIHFASAEVQTYLTILRREKKALELLIREIVVGGLLVR